MNIVQMIIPDNPSSKINPNIAPSSAADDEPEI